MPHRKKIGNESAGFRQGYPPRLKKAVGRDILFAIQRIRAIAQLVARLHGVQEVVGSNPTSPTTQKPQTAVFCLYD